MGMDGRSDTAQTHDDIFDGEAPEAREERSLASFCGKGGLL